MFQLKVAPGVTFMEGEWRGRFPSGNVLVLDGGRTRAIVDTGAGEEVLSAVAARGRVDVVINTHYHIDHVRGNGRFLGEGGADFWCPAGEAGALASWEDTPGHGGLWFPSLQVVFSADIDLGRFGPWYGDVHADIDEYLDSLRRLGRLVEEASAGGRRRLTILTSHRRPVGRRGLSPLRAGVRGQVRRARAAHLGPARGGRAADHARARPSVAGLRAGDPGQVASRPPQVRILHGQTPYGPIDQGRPGAARPADNDTSATTDSDHVGGNQL